MPRRHGLVEGLGFAVQGLGVGNKILRLSAKTKPPRARIRIRILGWRAGLCCPDEDASCPFLVSTPWATETYFLL